MQDYIAKPVRRRLLIKLLKMFSRFSPYFSLSLVIERQAHGELVAGAAAAKKTFAFINPIREGLFVFSLIALLLTPVQDSHAQTLGTRAQAEWLLEGMVTNRAGEPLDGAAVIAMGHVKLTAVTDSKGHFVLRGNEPGRYGVYAEKKQYVFSRIRRIELALGARANVDLELDAAATLSGRVLDRVGQPIANADIQVWVRGLSDGAPAVFFRGTAISNAKGEYRVVGLAEGNYYIGVRPPQSGLPPLEISNQTEIPPQYSFPFTFYPGVLSLEAASPIHIRPEEQVAGMDLVLTKVQVLCVFGSLSGRKDLADANRIDFTVSQSMGELAYPVLTGQRTQGQKFQVCGLVPGIEYTLVATEWSATGELAAFGKTTFSADSLDTSIHVGNLSMLPGQPVEGRMVIAEDESSDGRRLPPGVMVVARSATPGYINESRTAGVDESGQFRFSNLFPYDHHLRVLGLPAGFYVREVRCSGSESSQRMWVPGCGVLRVDIATDGASLSGRAIDENGNPVSDAQVILVPKMSREGIRSQTVDVKGEFRFTSVPPGDYEIVAALGLREDEAQNATVVGEYLSHAKQVELAPREQSTLTITAYADN